MPDTKSSPKRKGLGVVGIATGVFMAIIAVFMLPTTIIVVVGMIPTIVAYFVDTSKHRTLGPTVFYLNVAGVLPVLLKLWRQHPNINNAIELLTDPFMLLLMLAPAGFAWILFNYVPFVVGGILRRRAEIRMNTLENDQKKMIEQWGPEVTGAAKVVEKKQTSDPQSKTDEDLFTV